MIAKELNKDLSGLNSFRMRVRCRSFVEYDSIADIAALDFTDMPGPVKHIGAGSNLLFTSDFCGTILHSKVNFIEVVTHSGAGEVLVSVGAGVVFDDFCAWASGKGLWGAENLSYIPGEVGAAAVQNIGAYGVEAKDIIRTVHAFDIEKGTFVDFDASECEYGYRESHFKHARDRYIITHVDFVLSAIARPRLDYSKALGCLAGKPGLTPLDVREAVIVIRKQKLPEVGLVGSAGSFFKNPVVSRDVYEAVVRITAAEAASGTAGTATATTTGVVPHYDAGGGLVKIPAAWLIEQCGWRGHRCGNAGVWDMQPLVLINATGNALPEEIVALEDKIRASVKQRFGIDLECEVEHL